MRCQKCGRLAPGAARLCPQCARAAARRPSGVRPSGAGPRPPAPPPRYPTPPGYPPRPAPSGSATGVRTPPVTREIRPPRRRRRGPSKALLFAALLCVCFLAGYLLNPAGRTPSRPDPVTSQGAAASRSAAPAPSAVRAEAEALIPHFDLRWYLQQLDDAALENFCTLYRAIMDFREKVTFPNPVTKEGLQLLFFLAEYDCPEVMQLADDSRYTSHSSDGEIRYITVNYGLREEDYRLWVRQCTEVARRVAAQAQGLSEWERELAAIRYLNANCVYNADAAHAGSAYGSLVKGVSKCDGISRGFKWIAEEMGLTTFLLSGDARDGGAGHAWNCIRIDGEFSDVDVTSDVPFPDEPHECYFRKCNVPRQVVAAPYILRSYITDNFTLPEADSSDGSYYARMGRYVRTGDALEPWLRELCAQAERDGSATLTLQFESRADYDRFNDEFTKAMNDLTFHVTYSGWHDDTYLWRKQTVSRN